MEIKGKYNTATVYAKVIEEVVYFELDNQFSNLGCPTVEPFFSWVDDWRRPDSFLKTEWVKQNKLCVSLNIKPTLFKDNFVFRITALKSWVEKNCPGTSY